MYPVLLILPEATSRFVARGVRMFMFRIMPILSPFVVIYLFAYVVGVAYA
jgi:hypothetical protein